MPIDIEGVEYFTAADIQREAGIVRQTLWRWRREGSVPEGRRYRNKTIVFTRAEVEAIRDYSNRLVPVNSPRPRRHWSALANGKKGGRVIPRKNSGKGQP